LEGLLRSDRNLAMGEGDVKGPAILELFAEGVVLKILKKRPNWGNPPGEGETRPGRKGNSGAP